MWSFLEQIARFLNRPIIGYVTVGIMLAMILLIAGISLLISSSRQVWRIMLGSFLIAIALGYLWTIFSMQRR